MSRGTDDVPARKWKIFISHSSRDKKGNPTPVAGRILEDLRAKLASRFKLLIDDGLPAGIEWNPRIRWWLADCDAAIVLLDEKSFNSPWVKREVCILEQRRALRSALNSNFLVLPVIINLKEKLDNTMFADLKVIQSLKFRRINPDDHDGRRDIVEEIAKVVGQHHFVPSTDVSDEMLKWIDRVAHQLPVESEPLEDAAHVLGCHDAGIAMEAFANDHGRKFLASQLLNAVGPDSELDKAFDKITAAVGEMKDRGMTKDQRSNLEELLPPVWVDVERACRLLPHPDRHAERRLVLLPAEQPETATHYIKRALCCAPFLRRQVVQASGLPTGESADENDKMSEVLVDVRGALEDLLRNRGNFSLGPLPSRLYFLIIPRGDVLMQKEAVEWVHNRYPEVNILQLTGADGVSAWTGTNRPSLSEVIQLDILDSDVEARALQWVDDLIKDVLEVKKSA